MYYELTIDILYDFDICEPKGLPWNLSFIEGETVKDQIDNPFVFTTNARSGDKIPDFWASSFPAMSKRFVEVLEGAGIDNLQKFPAIVRSEKDETVWKDYYLVNILEIVSCADFSRSVYTELFPGSFTFDELAIDASKTKGALLFRLQESPDVILIHKNVGKHIGQMDPNRELVGWAAKKVIQ